MIIKVDDNNRKRYEELFAKAYKALQDKEQETGTSIIVRPNELERFVSLEEFFSQIADIYSANPSFLIRLPVDESVLVIDAEKRTIDTSLFKTCVTVQSDQIAEIVIFSIDRYFDYMDFMDTEIWVQWTAPNADGTVKQGATLIELKDVETEPGKVRFGWPLDSDITANPGTVHFAVRFFKRGDVPVYDDKGVPSIENKIIYSFNTLPATLTVKAALQPKLNSDSSINKPHGLFTYAIRNSIYAGEDTVIPQTPQFAAPGLDLPISATLKENTLTLKAQAVVGDTGNIRYEWYYTPVDGVRRNCAEHLDDEGNTVAAFGTIAEIYEETTATTAVLSDNYYTKDGSAYLPYYGSLPHPDGETVYEKYTTFTVPATGGVTGTYQVEAINRNGFIDGYRVASYPCVLVSPSSVVVPEEGKLTKFALIKGDPAQAVLSIVPTIAEGDNSEYTYEWYRSESKDGPAAIVKAFNESNILEIGETITLPAQGDAVSADVNGVGWYSVKVHSSLNRETRQYESEHRCKVTLMPTAPELAFADGVQASGDNAIFTVDVGEDLTFTVNASVANAQGLGEDDLYSETLEYNWTIQPADEAERELTTSDIIDASALHSNSIKVKVAEAATYTCTVTNHLNNETASDELSFIVMLTDAE